MAGFNIDEQFENFMMNVLRYPKETYIGCLCMDGGLFVFNREDKKFHSTDNTEVREFNDIRMYNYDESTKKSVMCVMVFPTLDYMLEYISMHNYDKDIANYMLQMKSLYNEQNL